MSTATVSSSDSPGGSTRAQRMRQPLAADVVAAVADQHGVCIRPFTMEVGDPDTGELRYVPLPCGSTVESVCGPCARKARALRMAQCREGWHLTEEPNLDADEPTAEQRAQLTERADLVQLYRDAVAEGRSDDTQELREAIREADDTLRQLGVRGRLPSPDSPAKRARKRSTRRRQDAPDLPTRTVSKTTLGREYAGRFRPSMFVTLTCPSYGRVHQDGTPVDPECYDYRRAARDAVHFASLVDRWWQNLRRVVGWEVQYFATVEPQQRAAPHLHTALRGSIPHEVIRRVTAATYHQVWWPPHDHLLYSDGRVPVWEPTTKAFIDPDTRQPLTPWEEALAEVTEPAHVVSFGHQVHSKGILGGTDDAGRHLGYLTKYSVMFLLHTSCMTVSRPRRAGGRTQLEIVPDQLVWALYGRESLDPKGTGVQVTNQLAELRPFALGIGGRIGREYPENNVSAFKRVKVLLPDGTYGYRVVRPDWDAMMTALRRGEFTALALPNIDRGMRDPRDLEDLIDLVEQYGVYVVGMTGSIDLTTDEGISSARREVDQRNRESRNISRRMAAGNRRAALAGRHHGGANRPFGWRKDRVTVNKREARHILRELPRLLAGVRPRSIAIEWNERGIPTINGGQWRMMTIVQIFTNPRLCGWRTYLGEVLRDEHGDPVRGKWEPILTEAQHLALVAALRPPTAVTVPRRGRGHATKRLLSPFVRCGVCNAKMTGATRKDTRTGERVVLYKCPQKGLGGCGRVSRTAAPIDELITTLVLMEQSMIALRKLEDLPPWDGETELETVLAQITETTRAYEAGMISGGRYFPMLARFEAKESTLRAAKRRYEAKRQARQDSAANLGAEWNRPEFTLEQKQAAIAQSLTAVIIHPAPYPGAKFTPDQITPVWRHDED